MTVAVFTRSGTVCVFEQNGTLQDAVGSHACWLEASMCVAISMPLGRPLPLTVATMNCIETLKVATWVVFERQLDCWITCTRATLATIEQSGPLSRPRLPELSGHAQRAPTH
jgi:hypothetical protein